jgi:hypothetical protein
MLKKIILLFIIGTFVSCGGESQKETASEEQELEESISTQKETNEQKTEVSKKTYTLNDISIDLKQTKGEGKEFYCNSKLFIFRDNDLVDSLIFTPEPVGGNYGISEPIQIVDHLIFTKHGDYDGRTIIVNNKGKIFNVIGGINFYDIDEKLLFTIYESDLGGFAVFDLKNDSIILEMQDLEHYPVSVHKAYGQRYFILSNNEDPDEVDNGIWEIEIDLDRIMRVDLDREQINNDNMLKTWELKEVSCQ